jgi:hypothetical protein
MMLINKTLSRGLLTVAAMALVPHAASAWSPKLEVSDTTWVQLGYLHQFWYQSVDDGAGVVGDRDRSSEFFTRRSRVMLLGQATETVHFFLNYDAASVGFAVPAGPPRPGADRCDDRLPHLRRLQGDGRPPAGAVHHR